MSPLPFYPAKPCFPEDFEAEKKRLLTLLASFPNLVSIEHFGSTAVPDLGGKGIIDILVCVRSLDDFTDIVHIFEKAGLYYKETAGSPNRRFFSDAPLSSPDVAFHYHIVVSGTPEHRDPILFRDALRSHPEWVRQYEELKFQLAHHTSDPHTYRDGKATFIQEILNNYKQVQ